MQAPRFPRTGFYSLCNKLYRQRPAKRLWWLPHLPGGMDGQLCPAPGERPMRLSAFIKDALEPILHEWDEFARSIQPPHRAMELAELRDHAEEMLLEIAGDLDLPQTEIEKLERSKGRGPARNGDSAAEIHATHRLLSGFTIDQLVAEYRALRT